MNKSLILSITLTIFPLIAWSQQSNAAQSINTEIIERAEVKPDGNLRVIFNNKEELTVIKEKGRYDVEQEGFENIQIAKNKRYVGWLATYRICAQSYACTAELVLFTNKNYQVHITPDGGIIWSWVFIHDGDQVAIHSGFPHGDAEGKYELYDVVSGKRSAFFNSDKTSAPPWVQDLLFIEK